MISEKIVVVQRQPFFLHLMGWSYLFKIDGNLKPLNENYGSEFDFNAG
jgi:hypothetical protein